MLVKCLKASKQLKEAKLSPLYLQIMINLLTSIGQNVGNEGMAKKVYKESVKTQVPLITTLKLDFTPKKSFALELQTKLSMPTGLEWKLM